MTRLGFLLDSDSCIGCHACTVACKSEHDVPIGVNRTWVKYIETGSFPDVARKFNVMRCNHCDDAPCMAICPTSALFRAENGVVDFNDDNCIGCKACMQGCPYDAIYINPETNTAHKCNFCNHRIEVGLEPSCVIVCPTQAIVVGDLDDPASKLSRMAAHSDIAVRAPEQNTSPKVFYRGADQAVLDPTRTRIPDDGLIWADTTPDHPTVPDDQGVVGRTTYTTAHKTAWGDKVSSYLVTKAIGGGVMLIAALLVLLGNEEVQGAVGVAPPIIAAVFTAITGALLVADLKQPGRFLYILTKGNLESWLVKGTYVLLGFGLLLAAWFVVGAADSGAALRWLAIPTAILGAGAAGYTAFLFAQCEGRDLWQSPLTLPILLAQSVTVGAGAYLVLALFMDVPDIDAVRWCLVGGATAQFVLVGMELASHGTRHVELALESMKSGEHAVPFRVGVGLGMVVPFVLGIIALSSDADWIGALGGVVAAVGLFFYERAFVGAGQSVPLS